MGSPGPGGSDEAADVEEVVQGAGAVQLGDGTG
ncbi:hypothetical protein EDD92_2038 [Streptomyces sp. TLI_185]|nr:hypothetical protein EDD92_2038 [Streptomyces sp. TLI_185]